MTSQPAPDQPALFDIPDDDDPAVLDDMAAELDDTSADPDDGEPGPADAADADEATRGYAGLCRGGPYHGRTALSRFPKGFLLVDKPRSRAWVYDFDGTAFACRDPAGATLDETGRWRAADEPTYDVIAYEPGEAMPG